MPTLVRRLNQVQPIGINDGEEPKLGAQRQNLAAGIVQFP
jgi:hypothetical protein